MVKQSSKKFGQHSEDVQPRDLLLSAFTEQLQQLHKQVDDVEIERGCCKHVLLRRDLLHDHLDIVDNVQREKDGASSGQTHVHHSVLQPYLPYT